jgi:hypothetical protein
MPKPFSWLLFLYAIAAVCTLGSAITAAYWFYPALVLEITQPVHVSSDLYNPGSILFYTLSYCKYKDIEAETHYAWTNRIVYSTTGMTVHTLQMGCHSTKEAVTVPNIPDGIYQLEMVCIYRPSPLRTVEVRSVSNRFWIKKLE